MKLRSLLFGLLSVTLAFPSGVALAADAPTDVAPGLSTGSYLSVALASNGTVWAWGRGQEGQLGNGQASDRSTPVRASGLTGVQSIGTTYDTTYAVMQDGTVRAWGMGDVGQIGDGATDNRLVPVEVTGLHGITSVAAGPGLHELAVDGEGDVWAWGYNNYGQLGEASPAQRETPALVPGIGDVVAVSVGGSFSLALKDNGEVWSWGRNKQGQLGDGSAADQRAAPGPIPGLSGIVAISAGYNHALALDGNGDVWAWGQNTNGAVGNGTYAEQRTPVKIAGVSDIASISAGFFHNLVIREDGTVWGWGLNNYYQLGDGTTDKRNAPIQVPTTVRMAAVSAGQFHSIAMDAEGAGWGWGYNGGGMVGDGSGTDRATPVRSRAAMDLTSPTADGGTLAVTGRTETSVTLRWTKASDNMTARSGIRYLPYVSMTGNIDTVARTLAHGMAAGPYLADTDTFELQGLQPGTAYYVNVVAEDASGNKSVYTMRQATTLNVQAYRLIYDGNGSSGGSAPVDARGYEHGMSGVVQGNTGLLYRTGYRFSGWNTSDDGTGVPYLPGGSVPFDDEDVTLYAQWTPDSTIDAAAPQAIAYAPGNGANGVSVGAKLSITFDEPVSAVAGKKLVVRNASDNAIVESIDAGAAAVTGLTASFRLSAALSYGATYDVQVEAGAFKDASGNDYGGTSVGAWTFTTADEHVPPVTGSDASLSGLSIAAGAGLRPISPSFAPNATEYVVTLPYDAASLSVTASVYDSRSVMSVSMYNGVNQLTSGPFPLPNGYASGALPTAVGSNRVDLLVTAEDGSTRLYRVTAIRASAYEPPSTTEGDREDDRKAAAPMTVNGRASNAASATTEESDGRVNVTVDIDSEKLIAGLTGEEMNPVVTIALDASADRATLRLSGEALEALRSRNAIVEFRTPDASYRLPAALLPIERMNALLGNPESPEDIVLAANIAKSGGDKLAVLKKAAREADFITTAPPFDFELTVTYAGKSAKVDSFDAFVERSIALPEWVGPDMISTAVVLEDDGTVRPVPTRIVEREGRTYALVSSLTNSTYSLIHHGVSFADMRGHWAETAVNDMASRMVVLGTEDGRFRPGASVTRAEFASMLVRALGLPSTGTAKAFVDVSSGAWYADAVFAAREYRLISGNPDGKFRPSDTITREEAAVVLTSAMKLAGATAKLSQEAVDRTLSAFEDGGRISGWARQAVAEAVEGGLATGSEGAFQPAGTLTRAEAAVFVRRLLQASGLIDR